MQVLFSWTTSIGRLIKGERRKSQQIDALHRMPRRNGTQLPAKDQLRDRSQLKMMIYSVFLIACVSLATVTAQYRETYYTYYGDVPQQPGNRFNTNGGYQTTTYRFGNQGFPGSGGSGAGFYFGNQGGSASQESQFGNSNQGPASGYGLSLIQKLQAKKDRSE